MKRTLWILAFILFAVVAFALIFPLIYHPTHHHPNLEARDNLRRLADNIQIYYEEEHVNAEGDLLPRQLPPSAAETPGDPARFFCYEGAPLPRRASEGEWDHPTWRALRVDLSGAIQRYSYSYTLDEDSSSFRVRVRADPDCDGQYWIREVRGEIVDNSVQLSFIDDP